VGGTPQLPPRTSWIDEQAGGDPSQQSATISSHYSILLQDHWCDWQGFILSWWPRGIVAAAARAHRGEVERLAIAHA
jgi:hypothetical protein